MSQTTREVVLDIINNAPEQFADIIEAYNATYGGGAVEPPAAPRFEEPQPPTAQDERKAPESATVQERMAAFLRHQREATGARDNPGFHRPWLK